MWLVWRCVRLWLVCTVFVSIHTILSAEDDSSNGVDKVMLTKINFPMKALQWYHNLIARALTEQPDSASNHTQRYEALNKSIDHHWQTCLEETPVVNVYRMLVCMENKSSGDMDILLHDIKDLEGVLQGNRNTSEVSDDAEWAAQVEDVKRGLPVVKKNYEFYVAIENAKLADQMKCYNEFSPLLDEYWESIDRAVSNCERFVPRGDVEELEQCCLDSTQPILSDIESKLLFISSCKTLT